MFELAVWALDVFQFKQYLRIVRGLSLTNFPTGTTFPTPTESSTIFWMTPVSLNHPRYLSSVIWKISSFWVTELLLIIYLMNTFNGLFLGTTNEVCMLKSNSLPKWYPSAHSASFRKILGFMVVYLPSLTLKGDTCIMILLWHLLLIRNFKQTYQRTMVHANPSIAYSLWHWTSHTAFEHLAWGQSLACVGLHLSR